MKTVIDISKFNTITDWSKIKDSVDAVIIRLGYRGYGKSGKIMMDPKAGEFTQACIKNKIPFGYYFFPTSITQAEAIAEADWVISNLPKEFDKNFLPIFADSESATADRIGRSDNLSKSARTKFLKSFCDRLIAKGYKAGVYASTSWLINNLNMTQLDYPVWVAQYNTKCTYTGKYIMWQYTSKGVINGIKGNVDISQWYDEQNTSTNLPFTVKVDIDKLPIRQSASLKANIVGYTGIGVFTIVETMDSVSSDKGKDGIVRDTKSTFGKLKSGAGWIDLSLVKKL